MSRFFCAILSMLIAMTAFTGCANDEKKTKEQVDKANDDMKRMGQIDNELQLQHVYVGKDPSESAPALARMDSAALAHVDALVSEFIRCGHNIDSTAGRKGVVFSDDGRAMVRSWTASAEKVQALIRDRNGRPESAQAKREEQTSACPEYDGIMRATSVPQGEAMRYITKLGIKDVDVLSASTTRVKGEPCRSFVTKFNKGKTGTSDSKCTLRVFVDYDKVDEARSDRAFKCK